MTSHSQSVLKIEGPPGSGKTREMARETCRLIAQDGIAAGRILMLGISPAVKQRFRQALFQEARLAGIDASGIDVATFEEFLVRLLQGENLSEETETHLLPESDARILLHRILKNCVPVGHPLHYAAKQPAFSSGFFGLIRQLQLKRIEPDTVTAMARNATDSDSRLPLLADVYRQFTLQTAEKRLYCHADLVNRAVDAVEETPSAALAWVSGRYSVILIDEAQELSEAQHRLLARLPVKLVLAGNDKLSIRSFRGARPDLFRSLLPSPERRVTLLPELACMRGNEPILSLLNTFLPEPIWEEQAVDTARLKDMVGFGFYPDPALEAEGLAELIDALVRRANSGAPDDENPAARWDDCVILLRSPHYKHHLVSALSQRGIPFRTALFTDSLIQLQHYLYDFLHVLESFHTLGLQPGELCQGSVLRKKLARLSLPAMDKLVWMCKANRHFRRWLESEITETETARTLRYLLKADPSDPDAVDLLLAVVAEARDSPELARILAELDTFHVQALAHERLSDLLVSIQARWQARFLDSESLTDDLVQGLDSFRLNLERLEDSYRKTFGSALPVSELLEAFPNLWEGVESFHVSGLETLANDIEGRVRIETLQQLQGHEAPFVFIPFMVGEEFPYTRELSELLSPSDQERLGTDLLYRIDEAEEARLLALGMSRATRQVVLSCHKEESDAPSLPSVFYTGLLRQYRRLLSGKPGDVLTERICWCESPEQCGPFPCEVDYCSRRVLGLGAESLASIPDTTSAGSSREDDLSARYVGESSWARFEIEVPEPFFAPEETVYLTASSIKTYMGCPRQFYYQHLLKLPQPGSDAASLGILIHRLMEIFNIQARPGNYTAERLKALAEIMFAFDERTDIFLEAGFDEKDLSSLRRLGALSLANLKRQLMESVNDLERKGYFDRYGAMCRVEAEKRLEGFALEGLDPRCRFTGVLDAVIENQDGSVEILDYKTYGKAFGTAIDRCDANFRAALSPLPDGEELDHAERFADKLNRSYPTDYQLPLYYLACRQDPAYGGKLAAAGIQIIRPAFPGKPYQGAIRLALSGAEIEAAAETVLADINRHIVEPILDSSAFAPNPGPGCGTCGFYGICDASTEGDAAEGGEE